MRLGSEVFVGNMRSIGLVVVGVGMSACLGLGAPALGGCAQPGCDPEARGVTHRCGAPEGTATETGSDTDTDTDTDTDGTTG